jgi:hypothetical protein
MILLVPCSVCGVMVVSCSLWQTIRKNKGGHVSQLATLMKEIGSPFGQKLREYYVASLYSGKRRESITSLD